MSRNQRGLITIDFLFAMVMVLGFSALFFALSLTLTVVEITQYATFAAARVYAAAPVAADESERAALANAKFQQVLQQPALSPFFTGSWFELRSLKTGDHNDAYPQRPFYPKTFWGTRVTLLAKVLNFEIPLYGPTSNDSDGEGFTTKVGSYLWKEISSEECMAFNQKRIVWIKSLDPEFGRANINNAEYKPMSDNGC